MRQRAVPSRAVLQRFVRHAICSQFQGKAVSGRQSGRAASPAGPGDWDESSYFPAPARGETSQQAFDRYTQGFGIEDEGAEPLVPPAARQTPCLTARPSHQSQSVGGPPRIRRSVWLSICSTAFCLQCRCWGSGAPMMLLAGAGAGAGAGTLQAASPCSHPSALRLCHSHPLPGGPTARDVVTHIIVSHSNKLI